MKIKKPKLVTWWIAVILAIIGVLASQGIIPVLSGVAFWLVVIGFVILTLGTLLKGM